MCGIIGMISKNNQAVAPYLIQGLERLAYRGYDASGIATLEQGQIKLQKAAGKISVLAQLLAQNKSQGTCGIAHTRWATHGAANDQNAHPHQAGPIALVHNGIVENYASLKETLEKKGAAFLSQTDSEVVAQLLLSHDQGDMIDALKKTIPELQGAFALAMIHQNQAEQIVVASYGQPVVLGESPEGYFIASDRFAIAPYCQHITYLEDGDIAQIDSDGWHIFDRNFQAVTRDAKLVQIDALAMDKGPYRHYMQKEIFEQEQALAQTISYWQQHYFRETNLQTMLKRTKYIRIIACGTSYHAGLVAKYWLEDWAQCPCEVEVASEYIYRKSVMPQDALFIAISQSGETIDTIKALRQAKAQGYQTLVICNVAHSTITQIADLVLLTQAGQEIGVASTKAFTTQLAALYMISAQLACICDTSLKLGEEFIDPLYQAVPIISQCLQLKDQIAALANRFHQKSHALFLGRGPYYPIAKEAALKMKEISYIHAEAYPAGELKHGPLALIDEHMPVIVVAPNNELLDKLISNMQEVAARGGEFYIFTEASIAHRIKDIGEAIVLPSLNPKIAPLLYMIPLQLLSYYSAVVKGTDIDQPRNLAKSVTVE